MNLEQIRNRPASKAFTIKLTNGESLHVPHMDFVAIGMGILVVIDEANRVTTVDAEHIVAVVENENAIGN